MLRMFQEARYAQAVIGGIVATLVMGIFAYFVAPLLGLPKLDILGFHGTLFLPAGAAAQWLGMGIVLVGAVIAALIHEAWFRNILPGSEWLRAVIWGLILWIFTGVVYLPLVGAVHPMVMAGQMPNPGFFGAGLRDLAPVAILANHLVWGLILGLCYEALSERPLPMGLRTRTEAR